FRRGPGAVRAVVCGHRARDARRARADELRVDGCPLPRSRQADVRVRDAVGVLLLLAVPDHLGGEPAGGDHFLPRAPGQWMSVLERAYRRRALRAAVLPALVR